jgi:hypothetical protein
MGEHRCQGLQVKTHPIARQEADPTSFFESGNRRKGAHVQRGTTYQSQTLRKGVVNEFERFLPEPD